MKTTCTYCHSSNVIRYGISRTKSGTKQILYCKSCNRKFTVAAIRNKSYPAGTIIFALSQYNLGKTLKQTVKETNKRFKTKLPESTLHHWLKEYAPLISYKSMRDKLRRTFPPERMIVSKDFEHNGLSYNFKYHSAKTAYLCGLFHFDTLKTFLESLLKGTPDFFGNDQRMSTPKHLRQPEKEVKTNLACRMAAFALTAKKKNSERHALVEDFFLINDSATIAVEIPVWFWDKKEQSGWAGHIDILQIRQNKIYILDYKPDAAKERKAAAQLTLYAKALSYRTGLPRDNFVCAWFDDKDYFEFIP